MAFLDEEKNENVEITTEENIEQDTVVEEEIIVEEESADKQEKQSQNAKQSNGKPSKIKATFSELKKVTWPSFGSVVKKTAVVLSVTAIFLVVVFGIDQLLSLLYGLLTKNM